MTCYYIHVYQVVVQALGEIVMGAVRFADDGWAPAVRYTWNPGDGSMGVDAFVRLGLHGWELQWERHTSVREGVGEWGAA